MQLINPSNMQVFQLGLHIRCAAALYAEHSSSCFLYSYFIYFERILPVYILK